MTHPTPPSRVVSRGSPLAFRRCVFPCYGRTSWISWIANRVETTEEELEGYHTVKAIVCQVVDPSRVVHRDTLSYMGILLDDNNRKPICRLHFNTGQKYIGLFDEEKNEDRKPIESLNDVYQFAEELRETAVRYDEAG